MNPRITKKEQGLIKGALRRVFSRSELRKIVMSSAIIEHRDPFRPRVTKWGKCALCKLPSPLYKMHCDHITPIVGIRETMDDISWNELVNRLWCAIENLQAVCEPCHKIKSKAENAERRKYKKSLQNVGRKRKIIKRGKVCRKLRR